MRHFNSYQRKSASVGYILLGFSLMGITLYVMYRVVGFLLAQIELPPSVENFGFVAFAIAGTLAITSILLHLDMKSINKRI